MNRDRGGKEGAKENRTWKNRKLPDHKTLQTSIYSVILMIWSREVTFYRPQQSLILCQRLASEFSPLRFFFLDNQSWSCTSFLWKNPKITLPSRVRIGQQTFFCLKCARESVTLVYLASYTLLQKDKQYNAVAFTKLVLPTNNPIYAFTRLLISISKIDWLILHY